MLHPGPRAGGQGRPGLPQGAHVVCGPCHRAGVTAAGPGHFLGLHACLEVSGVHGNEFGFFESWKGASTSYTTRWKMG